MDRLSSTKERLSNVGKIRGQIILATIAMMIIVSDKENTLSCIKSRKPSLDIIILPAIFYAAKVDFSPEAKCIIFSSVASSAVIHR
jgi:hypothetical protein